MSSGSWTGGDAFPSADVLERSDAELLAASRTGDEAAYAELWSRHVSAAKALARRLTGHPSDADDLVNEAFLKVLTALKNGNGPTSAMRPYLLTAIRRLNVDRAVAGKWVQPTDDLSAHDPGLPFVDPAVADLENTLVATAYRQLPERWQMVLWHTEVEEMTPREVAPLLGMSPNAVAALALRARAGLREAYLAAHISRTSSAECEQMLPKLAAYVRGAAAAREKAAVERHLSGCEDCRAVLAELQDVGGRMRAVVAPLVLGTLAAAYLTDLASLPAAATTTAGPASGRTSSGNDGGAGAAAAGTGGVAAGAAAGSAGAGAGAGAGGTAAGAGLAAAGAGAGGWVMAGAAGLVVMGVVVGTIALNNRAEESAARSPSSSAQSGSTETSGDGATGGQSTDGATGSAGGTGDGGRNVAGDGPRTAGVGPGDRVGTGNREAASSSAASPTPGAGQPTGGTGEPARTPSAAPTAEASTPVRVPSPPGGGTTTPTGGAPTATPTNPRPTNPTPTNPTPTNPTPTTPTPTNPRPTNPTPTTPSQPLAGTVAAVGAVNGNGNGTLRIGVERGTDPQPVTVAVTVDRPLSLVATPGCTLVSPTQATCVLSGTTTTLDVPVRAADVSSPATVPVRVTVVRGTETVTSTTTVTVAPTRSGTVLWTGSGPLSVTTAGAAWASDQPSGSQPLQLSGTVQRAQLYWTASNAGNNRVDLVGASRTVSVTPDSVRPVSGANTFVATADVTNQIGQLGSGNVLLLGPNLPASGSWTLVVVTQDEAAPERTVQIRTLPERVAAGGSWTWTPSVVGPTTQTTLVGAGGDAATVLSVGGLTLATNPFAAGSVTATSTPGQDLTLANPGATPATLLAVVTMTASATPATPATDDSLIPAPFGMSSTDPADVGDPAGPGDPAQVGVLVKVGEPAKTGDPAGGEQTLAEPAQDEPTAP